MRAPDFQWLGRVAYADGLALQESLVARRRAGEIPDTVLLLEHEPVYTIGRTPDKSSLRAAADLPHPVVEISRGGQATWHGPGQLVGYPILALQDYGADLHTYLRALEESLISACASLGLTAGRREGMTGVWTGPRKLASIGVGVRHWISMHGFAINVSGDLAAFSAITPCGLSGVEITSVSRELGREVTVEEFAEAVKPALVRALGELARGGGG